jgi:hypothetical protein
LKPNAAIISSWGQAFNNDGTKFFLLQNGLNNSNTFTLSRPYDLTSVTSSVTFTAATSGGSQWTGLSFRPDYKYYAGTNNGNSVRIYSCTTRGVISASDTVVASILSDATLGATIGGISWSGKDFIFVVDVNYLVSKLLFSESAGTLTYTGQQVDVNAALSSRGILVNQTGTKMIICDTSTVKSIYEYYLRTPYDLTTYVLAPTSIGVAALVTDEPATMAFTDITTNPEMTRIYVSDFSTSIANSRVYQLRIK